MYESFFSMHRRPFSATPDPNCFADLEPTQAALDELAICIESGQGIGILTGAAGTGKSLLCQRLVAGLGESFEGLYISSCNFVTIRSLLQALLYELGFQYTRMTEQELRLQLHSAIKERRANSKTIVLVLDEAHLLTESLLEEIRTITDWSDNGVSLARVILSGQFSLEETLTSVSLAALNQRVRCQVCLESLTSLESADYIAYRVQWAGSDLNRVFTPEAIQLITHASDGVPRCLNQLCDHSLLCAFVIEQIPVQATTARDALDDLKQLPLQWNEPIELEPRTDDDQTSESQVIDLDIDEETDYQDELSLLAQGEFDVNSNADRQASDPIERSEDDAEGSTFEIGSPVDATDEGESSKLVASRTVTAKSTEAELEEKAFDIGTSAIEEICGSTTEQPVNAQLMESMNADVPQDELKSEDATIVGSTATDPMLSGVESGDSSYDEEDVVDPYAAIDARCQPANVSGIVWDLSSPDESAENREVNGEQETAASEIVNREVDESDMIVAEAAQVEQTTDGWFYGSPSASDSPADVDIPHENPDEFLQAQDCEFGEPAYYGLGPQSDSKTDTIPIVDEIEEQLGAEILDMCLEVQEATQHRRTESEIESLEQDSTVRKDLHGLPALPSYDIVEPEEQATPVNNKPSVDEPEIRADDSTEQQRSPHIPRRYGRLFSELRRRQHNQQ